MHAKLNIPKGYQAVMPYLLTKESEAFLEFLKKAFGATEKMKVMNKEGDNIMHGEAIVFGHCMMFGSPSEKYPEEPSGFCISVDDVDAVHKSAISAGATSTMEPADYGFGKFGGIKDQFGNTWHIVESKRDKNKQPALSPYFSLKDAGTFLDFLKKVFNAEEKERMLSPGSENIQHAETLVAGNTVMVCTGSDEWGYMTGGVSIAVPDVDDVYKKALAEGATSIVEPGDHAWGRFSGWKDPFGNTWWVASTQPDTTENVNPYISVKGCDDFMEFAKKVFDAEEKMKKLSAEGTVYHGEMKIFGANLMCSEGSEAMGYITSSIAVRVPDTDEIYKRAIAAGCTSKVEPKDTPWGRFCSFRDAFGNTWVINQEPQGNKKAQAHEQVEGVWSYFSLKDAAGFLEFVKKVFNAEEKVRKVQKDGVRILHAETSISGGIIMCSEGNSDQNNIRNGGVFVYVANSDETHKVALAEGATELMPPSDQNYGRSSGVRDPYGNTFWITSAPVEGDVLGKRNGDDHPVEKYEPDVEKKTKSE